MPKPQKKDRRLEDARAVTVVCRTCESRTRLLPTSLDGLARAGIERLSELKRWAYCEACEYRGEKPQNLRFHAEWQDSPQPALQLVWDRCRA